MTENQNAPVPPGAPSLVVTQSHHNQTNYSTKLDAALFWLKRGFLLLPCQPDSKRLVKGYGMHQRKIKTSIDAEYWFRSGRMNLAILGWESSIILDFDDPDLYRSWAEQCPEAARSLTEMTPRGGYHVFMFGDAPKGVVLLPGVELKRVVLVYPSTVDGKQYTQGEGNLLDVDGIKVLSPLSQPGHRTPYLLDTVARKERAKNFTTLDRIKMAYTIVGVLQAKIPGFQVYGKGRFATARCPFHKDGKESHPSFWIDVQKNFCSCHACGFRGDVINVYARLEGISNLEAIHRLKEGLK